MFHWFLNIPSLSFTSISFLCVGRRFLFHPSKIKNCFAKVARSFVPRLQYCHLYRPWCAELASQKDGQNPGNLRIWLQNLKADYRFPFMTQQKSGVHKMEEILGWWLRQGELTVLRKDTHPQCWYFTPSKPYAYTTYSKPSCKVAVTRETVNLLTTGGGPHHCGDFFRHPEKILSQESAPDIEGWTHLANGPWNKSLNFMFPTKYGIPKSLKG